MKCPSCNKDNKSGAKFCGFCGTSLSEDQLSKEKLPLTVQKRVPEQGKEAEEAPSTGKKRPPVLLIIIPGIMLLAYAIYAVVASSTYRNYHQNWGSVNELEATIVVLDRIADRHPLTPAAASARKDIRLCLKRLHSARTKEAREKQEQARIAEEQRKAETERERTSQVYYMVYDTYRDVNDPYLNLRASPDPKSRIVHKMKDGTKVVVLGTGLGPKNKWWKIRIKDTRTEGYAHSRYLKRAS